MFLILPVAAVPVASAAGPLAPFVIGGITAFFAIKSLWSNPNGALKVQLTTVYNDSAEGLEKNMRRYLEEPASFQAQKERLEYFDNVWKYLHDISFKTAQGIISWNERQRNGKYPWEKYYRDPIANDPRLASMSGSGSQVPQENPSTGYSLPILNQSAPVLDSTTTDGGTVFAFLLVLLAIILIVFKT